MENRDRLLIVGLALKDVIATADRDKAENLMEEMLNFINKDQVSATKMFRDNDEMDVIWECMQQGVEAGRVRK